MDPFAVWMPKQTRTSDGSPFLGVQRRESHNADGCSAVNSIRTVLGAHCQVLHSGFWRNISLEEICLLDITTMPLDLEDFFFAEFPNLMPGPLLLLFFIPLC